MDQWSIVDFFGTEGAIELRIRQSLIFLGQGREGGIIGALSRIIGTLQICWDRGWPGSEGAKYHWIIVLFFIFVKTLPGSLDHWIIGANWNYLHITSLY